MLLFKFFLDFFFFFFTGSKLQLPATRQSGESHGPTAGLGSQRCGAAIRGTAALLTPKTAGLAQHGNRDSPHQPGACEQARGLLVCSASKHPCTDLHLPAVTHAGRLPQEPPHPWGAGGSRSPLLREGASPGSHLKPHVQAPVPGQAQPRPCPLPRPC